MKYISEFRDLAPATALAAEIAEEIRKLRPASPLKIMEVCGGHTMSLFKYGIPGLLPAEIRLLSGPGCPVCVTSNAYLDRAIALSKRKDVIITTFGDLIRVPGSSSSLMQEKSEGADVRICYSSLDALEIARQNPSREVVFLGIGFETTAPTIGAAVLKARDEGVKNFSVLTALKTMPAAMKALLDSKEVDLTGFICPGHVSVVTGLEMYQFIAQDYRKPCVISGFEPLDLLQSILMIVRQLREGRSEVENQYGRVAKWTGNPAARKVLDEAFSPTDVPWRGLGVIPGSGLGVRSELAAFDAERKLPVDVAEPRENPGCICGSIMRGAKTPLQCALFAKACTPESPKGSCMVSDEGTCAAYYKYRA